jgi:hypothetical protein
MVAVNHIINVVAKKKVVGVEKNLVINVQDIVTVHQSILQKVLQIVDMIAI